MKINEEKDMFIVNDIYQIQFALHILIGDKLINDGYADLANLNFGKYSADEIRRELKTYNHGFEKLYEKDTISRVNEIRKNKALSCREKENKIVDIWAALYGNITDIEFEMKNEEAKRILEWLIRFSNMKHNYDVFVKNIILEIVNKSGFFYDENYTEYKLFENSNIIYDENRIDPCLATSLPEFLENIYRKCGNEQKGFICYRGHSDINYMLLPAVYRKDVKKRRYLVYEKEDELYNEIQVKCFKEFQQCKSHLEKLVIMQHFGIPTRLMDVTTNPLVAAYFACSNLKSEIGEVILLDVPKDVINWPNSDMVSVFSSFSALSYKDKNTLSGLTDNKFEKARRNLLEEIKTEKPGFEHMIRDSMFRKTIFVYAPLNNQRIINQQGAFLLFGLKPIVNTSLKNSCVNGKIADNKIITIKPANEFRLCNSENKKIVVFIKNKADFLDQLKAVGIDKERLFPEIASIAKSISENI